MIRELHRTHHTCIHGDGGAAPLCRRPLRVLLLITVRGWSFREVQPHHLQETCESEEDDSRATQLLMGRTHLYSVLHLLQLLAV